MAEALFRQSTHKFVAHPWFCCGFRRDAACVNIPFRPRPPEGSTSSLGADTLFIELNRGRDQGIKPVVLFVPSNLDCPRGIVQVGQ